ncbi:MAG: hypothetical protein NVSMB5_19270 [Candidatus Velthaea sp.]
MKCSGSPTTCIAVNREDERARITGALQAVIFSEILKPLTAALGPFGDVATGSIAQSLFVKPR